MTYGEAWRDLRRRQRLPFYCFLGMFLVLPIVAFIVLLLAPSASFFIVLPLMLATWFGFMASLVYRAAFRCPGCGGRYMVNDWWRVQYSSRRCCHCGLELRTRADSTEQAPYGSALPGDNRIKIVTKPLDKEASRILRSCGIALICFGVLDIGVMVYAVMHRHSYSSSFNIFAVIIGIILMRGSLRAANVVVIGLVFFTVGMVTLMVGLPLIIPLGLALAELGAASGEVLIQAGIFVLIIGLFLWIIRSLRSAPVTQAQDAAGVKRPRLTWPALAGSGLVLLILCSMYFIQATDTAKHAIEVARSEVEPGYDFYVSSLSSSLNDGEWDHHCIVTAWKGQDIRTITVEWRGN